MYLSTCGLMLTMTGMIFYFHFNASGSRRKFPECNQENADHGSGAEVFTEFCKETPRWSLVDTVDRVISL
jgi:hypothetical protein